MTIAAHSSSASSAPLRGTSHTHRLFAAWQILPALVVGLLAFLALTPDGVAVPLQLFASWVLVGAVAVFAVGAIAKGLERVLDCDVD